MRWSMGSSQALGAVGITTPVVKPTRSDRNFSRSVPVLYAGSVSSDRSVGEQPVELGVAVVHADLHAAGQPGVAALEAVDQRGGDQTGTAVAEVLEGERLERDALGRALEGEGLHEPVLADLVEGAVEAVLLALVDVGEAPAATGACVPVVDPGVDLVGTDPLHEQLGVGVRLDELRRRGT